MTRIKKYFVLVFILILFGCSTQSPTANSATVKPVDLVYPLLDTENSRWFFFSSACRPFGMVNLSPDTEVNGAWGSGYRYNTETIQGFSHIHAWQISGLSVMPVQFNASQAQSLFTDYTSKFSHDSEKVTPGYHYVELDRYGISAELTSTKRVGFHRYLFSGNDRPAILFNLNGIFGPCELIDGTLEKTADRRLIGKFVNSPTKRRPKPLTVFFQIEFNTTVDSLIHDQKSGNYLAVLHRDDEAVLMKAGISYTSTENAAKNIKAELPHWNFEHVTLEAKEEWNTLLSRIKIEGNTEKSQRRFYTDLWHALQGRRIISDVNGAYPDNTGDHFRIGQLPLDEKGTPLFNHYNSDSFWGAQWTINTLWGLAYPDIMEEFVRSLMQYYEDGGMIPRGPSGGNYTFVMTGASATPFIVSAIQKGIVENDLENIFRALKKNHSPGGIMEKAGYEHQTSKGGGFGYYLQNGFVPYPIPEGEFGYHQDGASLTMEYAYQDWTLAQFAKKLEHTSEFLNLMQRSQNYRNVFDENSGWMRPKNVTGDWREPFDIYQYEHGFNESNAAQSTWFVPHDMAGLAKLMGGEDRAAARLNAQFEDAMKLGFTAGNSHDREMHPEYSRIPINYGNQPSIQTAFVFNQLDRPELTQYWSNKVIEAAFSGLTPATGYNGDEDQGLMGSLAVLMKLGLFQMNGGTEENPEYEISSPLFEKITINLHPKYYPGKKFVITSEKDTPNGLYITGAQWNDKPLKTLRLRHSSIVNGGNLALKLSENPSR